MGFWFVFHFTAKKMDVVYVLGTGSMWDNNELRFSLRSICRNLQNVRNVVVVGERPDFLQNVIHIPAGDIFEPGTNADGNIITKVLAACNSEQVSDDFLFINDDHLVLKAMNVGDVPAFHKGDMTTFDAQYWKLNYWRGRLKQTMEVLASGCYPTMHYDCHTPILFNKHVFREVVRRFDYASGTGYTMKSLYGNLAYKEKGVRLTTEKETIFKKYSIEQLHARLKDASFMSFNDDGLNNSLKWWLIDNFRSKCKYEKNSADDRVFDLYFWVKRGKTYAEGVAYYEKWYHKHMNLVRLFKSGESEYLRKKLDFKLTQIVNRL